MPGPRLVLVADDQRLANAIQTRLVQALGRPALLCRTDSCRDHLGPQTDGLLLLALALPCDPEPVQYLVQEVRLQKLPPPVLVVAGDGPDELLPALEPHFARRLRWSDEADALVRVVRERLGPDRNGLHEETVPDIVRRRLLTFTPSLLPLLERIALAAVHDVTVLLTGETGTGKTYLARLMHECSPRRSEPFLSVPCGAQPANLVESVFFGHVKGAFTGADRTKIGKFAVAGKGTLLLDEIDTLGLEAQAGLLRVIETGEYEPVGSNETHRCQARLIVASNWDLETATRQGRFRPDLYYRLNVMSFHLPPLRERVQDVAPLARAMAARFNTKFRKQLFDISPEAMAALESHDWPGNLRQLENVVQQAVLVSKGPVLRPDDLPEPVRDCRAAPRLKRSGLVRVLDISRDNAERTVIERALQSNNYSRSRTARSLGISRVTLYKKMKKYGLDGLPRQSLDPEGPPVSTPL
ncbi:MAG: sigma-54-dependent Fis family transcriptional regulator [Planctomycetes bacterium]|nr:sigma-54-dependent Fis family transcriptional regulator [Planctomycetota bacterium]